MPIPRHGGSMPPAPVGAPSAVGALPVDSIFREFVELHGHTRLHSKSFFHIARYRT
jgi:hypothetical protein